MKDSCKSPTNIMRNNLHRTQKIVIYYCFVGYIYIPEAPLTEHYVAETRQGIAAEHAPA